MFRKWLIKNNNQKVSLRTLFNKLKEFADSVIINYNLNNSNYVGINLIEKDDDQKGKHMTLEKLGTMLVEFKDDIKSIKEDVKFLKEDVKFLKEDVKFLKEDVKLLKEDVKLLKEDVKFLKEDVKFLKEDVKILKKDVSLIMACPTIKKEISQI